MVVTTVFTILIGIAMQIFNNVNRTWQNSERQLEMDIQAQLVFATFDMLLAQNQINTTINTNSNGAANGFALMPVVAADNHEPLGQDGRPDDEKLVFYGEYASYCIFPASVEALELAPTLGSNFYVVAIIRNFRDQLVVRALSDAYLADSGGNTAKLGDDLDFSENLFDLLELDRNKLVNDIHSNTGFAAETKDFKDDLKGATNLLATNVTMFRVDPMVELEFANVGITAYNNSLGVAPMLVDPTKWNISTSGDNSNRLAALRVEFRMLNASDYQKWMELWPERFTSKNAEPTEAKRFREQHERTYIRVLPVAQRRVGI